MYNPNSKSGIVSVFYGCFFVLLRRITPLNNVCNILKIRLYKLAKNLKSVNVTLNYKITRSLIQHLGGQVLLLKSKHSTVNGGIPTFPEMLKATLATADP